MKKMPVYIYRIISKDNLEYILRNRKLCCSQHPQRDPDYKAIGETTLIQSRKSKPIIIGENHVGTLGEYIPFYFGDRPPMLYAIQRGYDVEKMAPAKIIYVVSSLEKLREHECHYVFTDGHAYDALTQFFDDDSNLNAIDWDMVHARNWKKTPDDPDKKRRKQAECLVWYEMPIESVEFFAVYNGVTKRFVEQLIENKPLITFDVKLKPEWYY